MYNTINTIINELIDREFKDRASQLKDGVLPQNNLNDDWLIKIIEIKEDLQNETISDNNKDNIIELLKLYINDSPSNKKADKAKVIIYDLKENLYEQNTQEEEYV